MGPEEEPIEVLLQDVRRTIRDNQAFLEMLRTEKHDSSGRLTHDGEPEPDREEFEEL